MRRRGFWYFVIVWGVCYWGGLMFVATSVVNTFRGRAAFHDLVFTIPLWFFCGFAFGVSIWWQNERRYAAELQERNSLAP